MPPRSILPPEGSTGPGRKGMADIAADALEAWHQQYAAEDGDSIEPESDVIQAVNSDILDYDQIETHVQQLVSATVLVDKFCTNCQHLLDHWPTLAGQDVGECAVGRHFHTDEIEAAARLGCQFCALLLSRLKRESLLDTFRKIEARLRKVNDSGTVSLSIQEFWGLAHSVQFLWLNFPGKTASHVNNPGAQAVSFQSHILAPTANLWKESISDPFEIAKMWLARCSSSHELCRSKTQHRPPSRLIYIGHGAVKLVVTADLPRPLRYSTLSYCWGNEPFTLLTLDNLKLFLDQIPLHELPQTFIDAINASRLLGIDYIWIDALCIIQKETNNSDWTNEAGHMSAVYGGTFVNLAASTATSVQEGFLQRPEHHNGGFIGRVTTNDYCRVQNFHSRGAYTEATTETSLATRAWAFQEKLLSPRTIYFGETGLFWECRTHISSEYLPDGFPGLLGGHLVGPEDMPWNWWDIVWHYSKANVTYSADRLPALSGIAARQQQVSGDQYLAGMWRESLVTQLPWGLVGKKMRRPEWRAPTWSWISIDGEARYWGYWNYKSWRLNKYIEVLDAWTTPSGPDPYGAVTDGQLTVSCTHLVRGRISTCGSNEKEMEDLVQIEDGLGTFPITIDCLEEASARIDGVVYLLPVIEGDGGAARLNPERDEILFKQLMVQGLVLQACSALNGPQDFRRIGNFALYSNMDDDGGEDVYQAFMDVLKKVGSSLAVSELPQTVTALENQNRRGVIVIK